LPASDTLESISTTGMRASQAFLIAGTRASGSDGASTMPATRRFTAFSTRLTWSAMADSLAGPAKVIVWPGASLMPASAPLLTFCQKVELVVLTMTAISPAWAAVPSRARQALSSAWCK
jgi:hypothetical protein